ncbi:hypothetical protein [Haloechinothrix salitolerans]|uniref:Uncharacterized protein n=1 Tax=Haloechinothrix salitolerans TaxID=926830 RepID=A0ABW2BVR7_9PSEU
MAEHDSPAIAAVGHESRPARVIDCAERIGQVEAEIVCMRIDPGRTSRPISRQIHVESRRERLP